MLWKVIFILVSLKIILIYSEKSYRIIHDRAELHEYNNSFIDSGVEFTFRKFNRTSFGLNMTAEFLRDIKDRQIMVSINAEKLYGMEYKRSATMFQTNVCKIFQRNLLGFKESFAKSSNMDPCNIVKGKYWIRNFMPDVSNLPKSLPLASYRIVIKLTHKDALLFTVYWYSKVERNVQWDT